MRRSGSCGRYTTWSRGICRRPEGGCRTVRKAAARAPRHWRSRLCPSWTPALAKFAMCSLTIGQDSQGKNFQARASARACFVPCSRIPLHFVDGCAMLSVVLPAPRQAVPSILSGVMLLCPRSRERGNAKWLHGKSYLLSVWSLSQLSRWSSNCMINKKK